MRRLRRRLRRVAAIAIAGLGVGVGLEPRVLDRRQTRDRRGDAQARRPRVPGADPPAERHDVRPRRRRARHVQASPARRWPSTCSTTPRGRRLGTGRLPAGYPDLDADLREQVVTVGRIDTRAPLRVCLAQPTARAGSRSSARPAIASPVTEATAERPGPRHGSHREPATGAAVVPRAAARDRRARGSLPRRLGDAGRVPRARAAILIGAPVLLARGIARAAAEDQRERREHDAPVGPERPPQRRAPARAAEVRRVEVRREPARELAPARSCAWPGRRAARAAAAAERGACRPSPAASAAASRRPPRSRAAPPQSRPAPARAGAAASPGSSARSSPTGWPRAGATSPAPWRTRSRGRRPRRARRRAGRRRGAGAATGRRPPGT